MSAATSHPPPSPIQRLLALFRPPPASVRRPRGPVVSRTPPNPASIGKGFRDPRQREGVRRIVVTIDDALFDRLRAEAVQREESVAATVRRLIERGFAAEEQSR